MAVRPGNEPRPTSTRPRICAAWRGVRRTQAMSSLARHASRAVLFPLLLVALGCGGGGGGDNADEHTPTPATTPHASATAPQPTASLPTARAWAVGFEHGRGVIARSEDGGANWSVILTPDASLNGVQFINRSDGWAVGGGEILHTSDGGDSWTSQIGNVSAVNGTPLLTKVTFPTEQRGIAVGTLNIPGREFGPPVILLTTDRGDHWNSAPIAPGQNPALQTGGLQDACVTTTGIGLAVGFGVSGNLALLSADGGATWSDITQQVGADLPVQPEGVACSGSSDLWIVGGGPTRIAHSADGGSMWTDQTSNTPSTLTGELSGITFVDHNTGWTAGGGPTVLHTVDRGASWIEQVLPGGLDGNGSGLLAISFATPAIGATVGLNETNILALVPAAFTTHDGGSTWERSSVPAEVIGFSDVSVVQ
jgi:photosystem II stability/assembly factor-like uncharacterized protein